jgi:hypothetical protein
MTEGTNRTQRPSAQRAGLRLLGMVLGLTGLASLAQAIAELLGGPINRTRLIAWALAGLLQVGAGVAAFLYERHQLTVPGEPDPRSRPEAGPGGHVQAATGGHVEAWQGGVIVGQQHASRGGTVIGSQIVHTITHPARSLPMCRLYSRRSGHR